MNGTTSKKRELSKRDKKPSTYRRSVTGNVNGKAIVQSDEPLPANEFKTVLRYEHALTWVNVATPYLLRQRQALREFGDDPDKAKLRPDKIVENYEQ